MPERIDGCPEFIGRFETAKKIKKATLEMSACGVYYAELNGKPVGDFVLAPGWTVYAKRIQVQSYDVTDLMERTNTLTVEVASGWYCGNISRIPAECRPCSEADSPPSLSSTRTGRPR